MLIPSTWTHRLTRAYTSTLNTPQVFHKHTPAVLFGKQLLCGGLLLHRHKTPLTRRFVVYYCSALYKRLSKGRFVWWPKAAGASRAIEAYQAQLLLAAGNPDTQAAPMW